MAQKHGKKHLINGHQQKTFTSHRTTNNLQTNQIDAIMKKTPITHDIETKKQNKREIIDLSLLQSALHDNWDLLRKLANHLNDTVPQQLQMLEEAITRKNAKQTREIAHALKGVLSNFGAHRATELAAKLEDEAAKSNLKHAETRHKDLCEEIENVLLALNDTLRQNNEKGPEEPTRTGESQ